MMAVAAAEAGLAEVMEEASTAVEVAVWEECVVVGPAAEANVAAALVVAGLAEELMAVEAAVAVGAAAVEVLAGRAGSVAVREGLQEEQARMVERVVRWVAAEGGDSAGAEVTRAA